MKSASARAVAEPLRKPSAVQPASAYPNAELDGGAPAKHRAKTMVGTAGAKSSVGHASEGTAIQGPKPRRLAAVPDITDPAIHRAIPTQAVPDPAAGPTRNGTPPPAAGGTPIDLPENTVVPCEQAADRGGGTAATQPFDASKDPPVTGTVVTITPLTHQDGGPCSDDLHCATAAVQPISRAAPSVEPNEPVRDLGDVSDAVPLLIELWRQRQDLRRAERGLIQQCQSICRRASGGDKDAGAELWAAVQAGSADPGLDMLLSPYRAAAGSLSASAAALEKQVIKLVRTLPLWTNWAVNVRGVAELSLGGLIGEAARSPAEYRSVSALWKRFGLAVIDGGRQRLIAGAEAAALHGYSPQRRAYAYTLSTNLMRSQRTGDPYRDLYDRRKAYELEREVPKGHAHNRALRVMVKALIRDVWIADRKG